MLRAVWDGYTLSLLRAHTRTLCHALGMCLHVLDSLCAHVCGAGHAHSDVGILCVHPSTMQRHNRTYRGADEVTDVLSFPCETVRYVVLLRSTGIIHSFNNFRTLLTHPTIDTTLAT